MAMTSHLKTPCPDPAPGLGQACGSSLPVRGLPPGAPRPAVSLRGALSAGTAGPRTEVTQDSTDALSRQFSGEQALSQADCKLQVKGRLAFSMYLTNLLAQILPVPWREDVGRQQQHQYESRVRAGRGGVSVPMFTSPYLVMFF